MELFKLSAVKLAEGIARNEFSAVEVMQDVINRARFVQSKCNAFVTLDEEGARAGAQAADRVNKKERGPLHGVPFTVKDLLDTRNLRTTYGSRAFAEHIPTKDAAAVARIRASGAILIGKTTTSEFASQILTDSLLCGVTFNPWNSLYSPGGSSGGTGVAVSTGASPIGISTDGGGSARIPAAACGILGLKPTLGSVPHETWPYLFGTNSSVSINTRETIDLVKVFNNLIGPHVLDPWTRHKRASLLEPDFSKLRGYKILYLPNLGGNQADRVVSNRIKSLLKQFSALGASTETEGEDLTKFDPSIITRLITCNLAARFRELSKSQQEKLNPKLHSLLDSERFRPDGVLLQAESMARSRLYNRLEVLFQNYDLIVSATVTSKPPLAKPSDNPTVTINGEIEDLEKWWTHLGLVNLTGHPAISIPCGEFEDGLPIGLHVIGKWNGEQDLINFAAGIEELYNWNDKWPTMD